VIDKFLLLQGGMINSNDLIAAKADTAICRAPIYAGTASGAVAFAPEDWRTTWRFSASI
jgi:hypothetical protein